MKRTCWSGIGVAALALTAVTAGVPAAHAATADTCGGSIGDYVGIAGLDVPFTGAASANGNDRALTVSPVALGINTFKTEIATGPSDSRYAIGPFEIKVDTTGRGRIKFLSYAGHARGTNVVCATGTRVTKISGTITVQDLDNPIPFTVSRV
ncbi:hypothetical protein ADK60_20690 [Streptomyces sp. XY431]|uniref:hypothetical protein n=1 Tax=Streptomyces sp. XY431 TaxID=1415562 RepID=UPI0006ADB68F|nr:hypothetical protein [Streptomyces sp. XY431]KOV26783.1 hypothetical protein ADK60_20690 [Streptomyces sp. XY431]